MQSDYNTDSFCHTAHIHGYGTMRSNQRPACKKISFSIGADNRSSCRMNQSPIVCRNHHVNFLTFSFYHSTDHPAPAYAGPVRGIPRTPQRP